jgi:hypothetical protein
VFLRQNGNNNRHTGTNSLRSVIGGTSGTTSGDAVSAVWQATQAVINAGASVINVNGIETTGVSNGNTTAGLTQILGVATAVCDQVSISFWDNIALTAAQRAAMNDNQRAWWMF